MVHLTTYVGVTTVHPTTYVGQTTVHPTYCKLNASSVDYRLDKTMAPTPSYSQKDLELAVEAHKDGLSLRECEEMFSVPRDTIRRKSKDEFPKMQCPGPKTVLGAKEEECLVEWSSECAKRGFPHTSEHLPFLVS